MGGVIQLSAFRYITCMNSEISHSNSSIKIEDIDYVIQNINSIDLSVLNFQFQNWAALTVVRDLVDAFSYCLLCSYRKGLKNGTLSASRIEIDNFAKYGIDVQFKILAEKIDIDPWWCSTIDGFNKTRNCLSHRQGIISKRDFNRESSLEVNWISLEFVRIEQETDRSLNFKQIFESIIVSEQLKIMAGRRAKSFREGEIVKFDV